MSQTWLVLSFPNAPDQLQVAFCGSLLLSSINDGPAVLRVILEPVAGKQEFEGRTRQQVCQDIPGPGQSSTYLALQLAKGVIRMAAQRSARGLPTKSPFFLPMATGFIALLATLLSIERSLSSR